MPGPGIAPAGNLLFSLHNPFIMLKNVGTSVEVSEENRMTCRQYCGSCPSYRRNSLDRYSPDALFCASGVSTAPSVKIEGCYCPACELFTRHHLAIGRFCFRQ